MTQVHDTTSAMIQSATLLAATIEPTAVPIPMTPAVAMSRTAIDSAPRRAGFVGRKPVDSSAGRRGVEAGPELTRVRTREDGHPDTSG